MTSVLRLRLFGLVLLSLSPAFASAHSVCFLLSADIVSYYPVLDGVKQAFADAEPGEYSLNSEILNESKGVGENCIASDLVVTIGTIATQYLLEHPNKTPLVSVYVTKSWMDIILKAYPDARILGAVYLDQPPARLMRLSRAIVGEQARVATLVGNVSATMLDGLQQSASDLGMALRSGRFDPDENPVRQLQQVMEGSDLYLVLPDTAEINRNTAKWIIYLSYKYRIPVIGFSPRYSEAGALLSIYSLPNSLGRQVGQMAKSYFLNNDGGSLGFQYPKDFSIQVNDYVQRALGIRPIDQDSLHDRLQAAED